LFVILRVYESRADAAPDLCVRDLVIIFTSFSFSSIKHDLVPQNTYKHASFLLRPSLDLRSVGDLVIEAIFSTEPFVSFWLFQVGFLVFVFPCHTTVNPTKIRIDLSSETLFSPPFPHLSNPPRRPKVLGPDWPFCN